MAREEIEQRIRALCEAGAVDRAVTLTLEAYGPEVRGYVRAIGGGALVDDAFSELAFDLWRGLPGFEWRCSARGYAFTLARHAVIRLRDGRRRAARREGEWARARWLLDAVARTRTPTPMHRRTELQARVRALRDRLSEEDRTLLVLRVDRALSFRELALVLGEVESLEDGVETRRAAARLRQRYQGLKDRLRRMMREEGLLESGSG